jgi:hypothetical protein
MYKLAKFPMWHSNQGWKARIVVIYPGAGWHHITDFHKLAGQKKHPIENAVVSMVQQYHD